MRFNVPPLCFSFYTLDQKSCSCSILLSLHIIFTVVFFVILFTFLSHRFFFWIYYPLLRRSVVCVRACFVLWHTEVNSLLLLFALCCPNPSQFCTLPYVFVASGKQQAISRVTKHYSLVGLRKISIMSVKTWRRQGSSRHSDATAVVTAAEEPLMNLSGQSSRSAEGRSIDYYTSPNTSSSSAESSPPESPTKSSRRKKKQKKPKHSTPFIRFPVFSPQAAPYYNLWNSPTFFLRCSSTISSFSSSLRCPQTVMRAVADWIGEMSRLASTSMGW